MPTSRHVVRHHTGDLVARTPLTPHFTTRAQLAETAAVAVVNFSDQTREGWFHNQMVEQVLLEEICLKGKATVQKGTDGYSSDNANTNILGLRTW